MHGNKFIKHHFLLIFIQFVIMLHHVHYWQRTTLRSLLILLADYISCIIRYNFAIQVRQVSIRCKTTMPEGGHNEGWK